MLKKNLNQPDFLPSSKAEMKALNWPELDILLIQGDAYLDHPAQGPALLGRWLVAHGYRVGLISQPRWRLDSSDEPFPGDFSVMGRPKLFAAVSAGSMDSMLAHYTAFRKKRSDDALTPGGLSGARPNRATLVYANLVRASFPNLPLIIGGVEASLRRLSHYDFWQDRLRRSILLESKADLLVYGPGEHPLLEIARRLAGASAKEDGLADIPGTAKPVNSPESPLGEALVLPSHEAIEAEPGLLIAATKLAEQLVHQGETAPPVFQASAGRGVLMNPPAAPLTTDELDFIYALPYSRRTHPSYDKPVPALEVLANSITTHRGCGGGCSFCSLALLQGRRVISRSAESILNEARRLSERKSIALSDVGAGTANLWGAECHSQKNCRRESCLWPKICPQLKASQKAWVALLHKLAALPNIKQVRVASGVRYDLGLTDKAAFKDFLTHFVGGQLKVAPEHLDSEVLKLMRKPGPEIFEAFLSFFESIPQRHSRQYLVPYIINSFPGSGRKESESLANWFKKRGWRPRQTQTFIPTPGTMATAMYYAGTDANGRPLEIIRDDRGRLAQQAALMNGAAGRLDKTIRRFKLVKAKNK